MARYLEKEGVGKMDLLVNLYDLQCRYEPEKLKEHGIVIKRALSPDKTAVLDFMKTYYTQGWADETEHAFSNSPVTCYIAVKEKEIVGIAAYDATAKGYFGPIAVKPGVKGGGVGPALLHDTMLGMKEAGSGYAVIGWVDDAVGFYDKCIKHTKIPDSEPEKTLYQNLCGLE